MTALQPFRVAVDDACLDDLRRRLKNARRLPDCGDDDGSFGVSLPLLHHLCDQWADAFDWRAAEARINRHEQYRVCIDGQPIHFLRIRSVVAGAMPLILTHGWPWTFWDMRRTFAALTDPLAHGGREEDAFDLVVPSLPGFAFSQPASPGVNFWRTADLWHWLMTRTLGFARYGAAGGDWGALVSAQLGHKYADHVAAVHMTQPIRLDMFGGDRPWRIAGSRHNPVPAATLAFERRFASHLAVQVIEPDTLGAALNDTPTGLLAWLLQRWCSWGGAPEPGHSALSTEQMLTDATIYWASGAIRSSLRYYAAAAADPWRPSHDRTPTVGAPSGVTLLAGDMPHGTDLAQATARFQRSPAGRALNLVHVAAHAEGGHFAHYENPRAVVEDIRATFRAAR